MHSQVQHLLQAKDSQIQQLSKQHSQPLTIMSPLLHLLLLLLLVIAGAAHAAGQGQSDPAAEQAT
jgi:hypothetical protein